MQPQRFEANDPSQGRLMVQQSLTHSLQTVYQLTKPASEDTAEGGDINGEMLVPNPFPSDVLDDRLQNDRESLTEVPSDMVKDDFSTFGDDINGRADCLQCPQCNETIITQVVHVRQKPESTNTDCSQNAEQITNHYTSPQNQNGSDNEMKTIFIITPTYHRNTQKIDLNSMCHTLTLVPQVVWIIIEDAPRPTNLVTQLLKRCRVKTVHLTVHTSPAYRVRKGAAAKSKPRGVEQRNAGLRWLRDHHTAESCNGVLYFGDDDNKYDLRLFEDVRSFHIHTHPSFIPTSLSLLTHTHTRTHLHSLTHLPPALSLSLSLTHTHTHTHHRFVTLDRHQSGRWPGQGGSGGRGQRVIMDMPNHGILVLLLTRGIYMTLYVYLYITPQHTLSPSLSYHRALPIDMAAFAVDLCELIKRPKARVGVNIHGRQSKLGYLETDFLQHFTSRSKVECRGSEKEVYIIHTPFYYWFIVYMYV